MYVKGVMSPLSGYFKSQRAIKSHIYISPKIRVQFCLKVFYYCPKSENWCLELQFCLGKRAKTVIMVYSFFEDPLDIFFLKIYDTIYRI